MTGAAPASSAAAVNPAEPVPGWAVQLLVDVAEIRRDLAPVAVAVNDHETRLRSLERRAYILAGAAAIVGAGASEVIDLIRSTT